MVIKVNLKGQKKVKVVESAKRKSTSPKPTHSKRLLSPKEKLKHI
jgi:hypothetical protein